MFIWYPTCCSCRYHLTLIASLNQNSGRGTYPARANPTGPPPRISEILTIPTLSPYPFVAVCRWEPAKEKILGESEGEFKLVLCDEVGAHFCVVSSRIVNAEFYTEKNKKIYAELQHDILKSVQSPWILLNLRLRRI